VEVEVVVGDDEVGLLRLAVDGVGGAGVAAGVLVDDEALVERSTDLLGGGVIRFDDKAEVVGASGVGVDVLGDRGQLVGSIEGRDVDAERLQTTSSSGSGKMKWPPALR
jgi:hypothetical protein